MKFYKYGLYYRRNEQFKPKVKITLFDSQLISRETHRTIIATRHYHNYDERILFDNVNAACGNKWQHFFCIDTPTPFR